MSKPWKHPRNIGKRMNKRKNVRRWFSSLSHLSRPQHTKERKECTKLKNTISLRLNRSEGMFFFFGRLFLWYIFRVCVNRPLQIKSHLSTRFDFEYRRMKCLSQPQFVQRTIHFQIRWYIASLASSHCLVCNAVSRRSSSSFIHLGWADFIEFNNLAIRWKMWFGWEFNEKVVWRSSKYWYFVLSWGWYVLYGVLSYFSYIELMTMLQHRSWNRSPLID